MVSYSIKVLGRFKDRPKEGNPKVSLVVLLVVYAARVISSLLLFRVLNVLQSEVLDSHHDAREMDRIDSDTAIIG